MGLKKAENQVKILLAETILSMCRNTLNYHAEICVEGLLGITLDNEEIFLVNINQTIKNQIDTPGKAASSKENLKRSRKEDVGSDTEPESSSNESESSSTKKRRKRVRRKKHKGEKGSGSENGELADVSANADQTLQSDETDRKFSQVNLEQTDGSEQYYENSNQTAGDDSYTEEGAPSSVNVTVKQEPPGGPESDDDLVFVKQEVDEFSMSQPSAHQFSNLSQVFQSSADMSLSQPSDMMSGAFFASPANNMSANAMQQPVPGPSGANTGMEDEVYVQERSPPDTGVIVVEPEESREPTLADDAELKDWLKSKLGDSDIERNKSSDKDVEMESLSEVVEMEKCVEIDGDEEITRSKDDELKDKSCVEIGGEDERERSTPEDNEFGDNVDVLGDSDVGVEGNGLNQSTKSGISDLTKVPSSSLEKQSRPVEKDQDELNDKLNDMVNSVIREKSETSGPSRPIVVLVSQEGMRLEEPNAETESTEGTTVSETDKSVRGSLAPVIGSVQMLTPSKVEMYRDRQKSCVANQLIAEGGSGDCEDVKDEMDVDGSQGGLEPPRTGVAEARADSSSYVTQDANCRSGVCEDIKDEIDPVDGSEAGVKSSQPEGTETADCISDATQQSSGISASDSRTNSTEIQALKSEECGSFVVQAQVVKDTEGDQMNTVGAKVLTLPQVQSLVPSVGQPIISTGQPVAQLPGAAQLSPIAGQGANSESGIPNAPMLTLQQLQQLQAQQTIIPGAGPTMTPFLSPSVAVNPTGTPTITYRPLIAIVTPVAPAVQVPSPAVPGAVKATEPGLPMESTSISASGSSQQNVKESSASTRSTTKVPEMPTTLKQKETKSLSQKTALKQTTTSKLKQCVPSNSAQAVEPKYGLPTKSKPTGGSGTVKVSATIGTGASNKIEEDPLTPTAAAKEMKDTGKLNSTALSVVVASVMKPKTLASSVPSTSCVNTTGTSTSGVEQDNSKQTATPSGVNSKHSSTRRRASKRVRKTYCEVCDSFYVDFHKHYLAHLGKKRPGLPAERVTNKVIEKVTCNFCQTLISATELRQHWRSDHANLHVCMTCGIPCGSEFVLSLHLPIHDALYQSPHENRPARRLILPATLAGLSTPGEKSKSLLTSTAVDAISSDLGTACESSKSSPTSTVSNAQVESTNKRFLKFEGEGNPPQIVNTTSKKVESTKKDETQQSDPPDCGTVPGEKQTAPDTSCPKSAERSSTRVATRSSASDDKLQSAKSVEPGPSPSTSVLKTDTQSANDTPKSHERAGVPYIMRTESQRSTKSRGRQYPLVIRSRKMYYKIDKGKDSEQK